MRWYDGMTFEQIRERLATSTEPLSVPVGFSLWHRLFEQLDRIESGLGPRTLPTPHVTSDQSGIKHLDVSLALEQAAREREALYARVEAIEKHLNIAQTSPSGTFTTNPKGDLE